MVHKTKKRTEKLATYGTQDEEKNRETGNIWYTAVVINILPKQICVPF
jgi:hypothetical protein